MAVSVPGPAPRIPPLPVDRYREDLKAFLAGVAGSAAPPALAELNVVRTLANHPDLAMAYMTFGTYVLGRSTLPDRVRELVTLRVASLSESDYEWSRHAGRARRAGMAEEEVEATKLGSEAPIWPDFERQVLQAVDQLHSNRPITDEVWDVLSAHLDQRQLLDLVFTVGCYVMLAMALHGLGVEQEP